MADASRPAALSDSIDTVGGTSIQTVAVLNRGEAAVRFCRALRDYNLERGTDIRCVAVVTDPDVGAPFTKLADSVIHLGPALQEAADGTMVGAYVRHDEVIAAIRQAGCDAVWPGWGFVAEDAQFVARLEQAGITFLGPDSASMALLGDKISSKRLAESVGVPVAEWSEIEDGDDDETILRIADGVGYPLMVKASAGGGGRGIRKVVRAEELLGAVSAARIEVRKMFGAGGLFVEKCVSGARHVEVQLIVGHDGRAWALGVRDCSIQRRNQKLLEETPSPILPAATARHLCESSARLATKAGYRSAGTAEFLYDPREDRAYFLEVNSRLQVEHPITELIKGVDLVHAQLDVARGIGLDHMDAAAQRTHGWAIEARLCAEDSKRDFAPSPGLVKVFRPPCGPGIRVDSGVQEGTEVAAEFDSMIAKVIAHGSTRQQAIARLRRALHELQVVIEDGATNKALLLDLLTRPEVLDGSADTAWLDRQQLRQSQGLDRRVFESLVFAAIHEYRRQRLDAIAGFFAAAQDGIPQNPQQPQPIAIDLRVDGSAISLLVHGLANSRYLVGPVDRLHVAHATFEGDSSGTLAIGSERHDIAYACGRNGITVEIDGASHTVELASGGAVKAPSAALVVQVNVQVGDRVDKGDRLMTLEAMKLEMPVHALDSGVVREVRCGANQQVLAGQVLIVIDAEDQADATDTGVAWPQPEVSAVQSIFVAGRPDLASIQALDGPSDADASAVVNELVEALQSVLLGHDVTERFSAGLLAVMGTDLSFSQLRYPHRWLPLVRLLECFADIEALFDRDVETASNGERPNRSDGLQHVRRVARGAPISAHSLFFEACRRHREGPDGVPEAIEAPMQRALRWYGDSASMDEGDRHEALWRMRIGQAHPERRHQLCSLLLRAAISLHEAGVDVGHLPGLQDILDRVARSANPRHRYVADNARQAEYLLFLQPRYMRRRKEVETGLDRELDAIRTGDENDARVTIGRLSRAPESLVPLLLERIDPHDTAATPRRVTAAVTEVILRRTFGDENVTMQGTEHIGDGPSGTLVMHVVIQRRDETAGRNLAAIVCPGGELRPLFDAIAGHLEGPGAREVDVMLAGRRTDVEESELQAVATQAGARIGAQRVTVTWLNGNGVRVRTWTVATNGHTGSAHGFAERSLLRDIHPEYASRFEIERLSAFDLTRIDAAGPVFAFRGKARSNARDERIFVYAGVRSIPDLLADDDPRKDDGGVTSAADSGRRPRRISRAGQDALWELERAYYEGLRVLRQAQFSTSRRSRYHWNRMVIYVREPVRLSVAGVAAVAARLESPTEGLGLEKVVVRCHLHTPEGLVDRAIVIGRPGRHRLAITMHKPLPRAVRAMSDYELNVVRARRLGMVYPYELVRTLCGDRAGGPPTHPDLAKGRFDEYDLAGDGCDLHPVRRAPGRNTAAVVVGVIENVTAKHPEGLRRVLIAADPTRSMCALAEPECRRVIGALELAREQGIPVEWVSISAGAKIAMDSGTENLDWTARVLRALVEFTQARGAVHVIVCGVNVGAQSYWNAEATMLMHTRGLLIMTADGSLVLTGKKALEISGSVAAEDERGIGGFERVMGPNGQAQLYAADLGEAYALLMDHYRFSYVAPGETAPRQLPTNDSDQRDVCAARYPAEDSASGAASEFATIGEIFDAVANPGRKRPFAIRAVMGAVIDHDGGHLERFAGMPAGETSVIWDAHIGGFPVCLVGFESRPIPRRGRVPTDGPDTWTGGTLFPHSSKKVARAINAASGNRPVVVLANLSGFDGSPDSLRALQLEYGAEIGRAVVNFDGPIVFVVIGRYHGGAYVVFSKALNGGLVALALTGTHASVIGGAPAAAVVFPRDVKRRAEADPRIVSARAELKTIGSADQPRHREALQSLFADVVLEKRGEVAAEFDAIHTVERAVEVGSLDAVIAPRQLRPEIIARLRAAVRTGDGLDDSDEVLVPVLPA